MLRGLYRVYLYIVYIAMLIFAAIGLDMFLQTILAQTLFRDRSMYQTVPVSCNQAPSLLSRGSSPDWSVGCTTGSFAAICSATPLQKVGRYVRFS